MNRKQRLQSEPRDPQRQHRHAHVPDRRCYSAADVIAFLGISPRTFFRLKQRGQMPFLEELRPRIGQSVRYRADLVDRWLAGEWRGVAAANEPGVRRHFFGTARTHA